MGECCSRPAGGGGNAGGGGPKPPARDTEPSNAPYGRKSSGVFPSLSRAGSVRSLKRKASCHSAPGGGGGGGHGRPSVTGVLGPRRGTMPGKLPPAPLSARKTQPHLSPRPLPVKGCGQLSPRGMQPPTPPPGSTVSGDSPRRTMPTPGSATKGTPNLVLDIERCRGVESTGDGDGDDASAERDRSKRLTLPATPNLPFPELAPATEAPRGGGGGGGAAAGGHHLVFQRGNDRHSPGSEASSALSHHPTVLHAAFTPRTLTPQSILQGNGGGCASLSVKIAYKPPASPDAALDLSYELSVYNKDAAASNNGSGTPALWRVARGDAELCHCLRKLRSMDPVRHPLPEVPSDPWASTLFLSHMAAASSAATMGLTPSSSSLSSSRSTHPPPRGERRGAHHQRVPSWGSPTSACAAHDAEREVRERLAAVCRERAVLFGALVGHVLADSWLNCHDDFRNLLGAEDVNVEVDMDRTTRAESVLLGTTTSDRNGITYSVVLTPRGNGGPPATAPSSLPQPSLPGAGAVIPHLNLKSLASTAHVCGAGAGGAGGPAGAGGGGGGAGHSGRGHLYFQNVAGSSVAGSHSLYDDPSMYGGDTERSEMSCAVPHPSGRARSCSYVTPHLRPAATPRGYTEQEYKAMLHRWVRVGKPLGKGCFGTVYLGQLENAEQIAVKVVDLDASPDDDMLEAFNAEFSVMEQLSHPNVVRCLGHRVMHADQELHIYLELCSGGTVADLVKKMEAKRLRPSVIKTYVRQVLDGLHYLHTLAVPVVHRDVKGANLLVTKEGHIKLSDFGCSKVLSEYKGSGGYNNRVGTSTMVGTPFWMAPEVIAPKAGAYGTECDIWSLGCTVLEMLGRTPWDTVHTNSPWEILYHIANSTSTPEIPDDVEDACLLDFLRLCFERTPSLRPTAAELLRHSFLADEANGCAGPLE